MINDRLTVKASLVLSVVFIILFFIYTTQTRAITQTTSKPATKTKTELRETIPLVVQQTLEDLYTSKKTRLLAFNIRLIEANISGNKIILNFSQELLSLGFGIKLERFFDYINLNITNAIYKQLKDVKYVILVEGIPLEQFYPDKYTRKDNFKNNRKQSRNSNILSTQCIVISPGHGWYWYEGCECWRLQRPYCWGIVEDFVNAEITMYLNDFLVPTFPDIKPTRNMNKDAGTGETGHPKWEEAAKYHIKSLGAPSSVWNSVENDDLSSDIRSRPLYANWVDADVLVSIHNNAGGGTGTEVLYDTTNGHQVESERLASILRDKIIFAIRENYDPNWVDRGIKGRAGTYGENRLADMPSVIIEIAFMDTQSPDNDALQDEHFKQLVADAISQGIEEFLDTPPPPPPEHNWPVIQYDIQHTGYNPYASSITMSQIDKVFVAEGVYAYSQPVVSSGIVYIAGNDGVVYAFDAETAELKWSYDTGAPIFSSPAIDNDTVYVVNSAQPYNFVYALNAQTGEPIWIYDTNVHYLYPYTSPVVEDGVIYFVTSNVLFALNENGTLKWRNPEPVSISTMFGLCITYSSPVIGDNFVLVNDYCQKLVYFDKETGDQIKQKEFIAYPWEPGNPLPKPRVWGPATVYSGGICLSRIDCIRDEFAPYPHEDNTGYLIAIDVETYTEKWRKETGAGPSPPVIVDDIVYVTGAFYHGGEYFEGYIWALDIETGAEIWAPYPIDDYAFLSIGGDILYANLFNRHTVLALDHSNLAFLWRKEIGSGWMYSPVVPVKDKVYVTCLDYVVVPDSMQIQKVRALYPFPIGASNLHPQLLGIQQTQNVAVISLSEGNANFTWLSEEPKEGEEVEFTDQSTPPDGIVSWLWDFGDGETSSEQNPKHTYTQADNPFQMFNVTLTVEWDDGGNATGERTVEVGDKDPTAKYHWEPSVPEVGQEITFFDDSESYDSIVSWSWDFGDSSTSTNQNPKHTYTNNGTYTVILTVKEADGDIDTSTKDIVISCFSADVNCDDKVNVFDVLLIATAWGTCVGEPGYKAEYDLNEDECIDVEDLTIVAEYWGQEAPFEVIATPNLVSLDTQRVIFQSDSPYIRVGNLACFDVVAQEDIPVQAFELRLSYDADVLEFKKAQLGEVFSLREDQSSMITLGPKFDKSKGEVIYGGICLSDNSHTPASETIARLEFMPRKAGELQLDISYLKLVDSQWQLLPITIKKQIPPRIMPQTPQKSSLLQNYPNPFNPDTWIPYQLRKEAEVTISIYNIKGQLIRQIYLGHQQAGYYLDKAGAVYWDGKNNAGENTASGMYFYQLQSEDFRAMRRMVIVK